MKRKKWTRIRRILKKYIRGCPLATMIVFSTILLSCVGAIYSLYQGRLPEVTVERPMFASVFTSNSIEYDLVDEGDDAVDDVDVVDGSEENNGNQSAGVESSVNISEAQTSQNDSNVPQNNPQNSPQVNPQVETVDNIYLKVDKSYFDDALFIGDSRVEGLKIYSELDNATFYCKEGISLTKILKEKIVKMKIKGKKKNVTIVRALKEKKFSKIYLMIGINEVSYRDTEEFREKYKAVVDKIKELQPEAKIIILGMMKVTTEYAKENPSFSNKNIQKKNDAIATLADNINVFYLDFNSEICNSKGGVKKKYTWDGVHLKAEYYSIWVDFLKEHGI